MTGDQILEARPAPRLDLGAREEWLGEARALLAQAKKLASNFTYRENYSQPGWAGGVFFGLLGEGHAWDGMLAGWAALTECKPLVLRGARQTGKTWLVRHFGERLQGDLAHVNLERDPDLGACFAPNDPKAVLGLLEARLRRTITPGRTLLFLDEIQEDWIEHRSFSRTAEIQRDLLQTIRDDFAKYKRGVHTARVATPVQRTAANGIPLGAE